jgi:hypothetical protein
VLETVTGSTACNGAFETPVSAVSNLGPRQYAPKRGISGVKGIMKTVVLCVSLLFALTANADVAVRAVLVGQRVVSSFPGSPILICRYAGPEANYEIVAPKARCARHFKLS